MKLVLEISVKGFNILRKTKINTIDIAKKLISFNNVVYKKKLAIVIFISFKKQCLEVNMFIYFCGNKLGSSDIEIAISPIGGTTNCLPPVKPGSSVLFCVMADAVLIVNFSYFFEIKNMKGEQNTKNETKTIQSR